MGGGGIELCKPVPGKPTWPGIGLRYDKGPVVRFGFVIGLKTDTLVGGTTEPYMFEGEEKPIEEETGPVANDGIEGCGGREGADGGGIIGWPDARLLGIGGSGGAEEAALFT